MGYKVVNKNTCGLEENVLELIEQKEDRECAGCTE